MRWLGGRDGVVDPVSLQHPAPDPNIDDSSGEPIPHSCADAFPMTGGALRRLQRPDPRGLMEARFGTIPRSMKTSITHMMNFVLVHIVAKVSSMME